MRLPRTQLNTFTLVTSEANWNAYFGDAWPTKAQCLQGQLRPWARADGRVYAQCSVYDHTPDKRVLGKTRGRPGGPSLKDICEREGSEVYGGEWPRDRFKNLPPHHWGYVFRASGYRHREPGKSLKTEVEKQHGKGAKPDDRHRVLAQHAKQLVGEGTARRILVPLAEIQPGDVIEHTHVRPGRIAGE